MLKILFYEIFACSKKGKPEPPKWNRSHIILEVPRLRCGSDFGADPYVQHVKT
jgi:hypothetical protein